MYQLLTDGLHNRHIQRDACLVMRVDFLKVTRRPSAAADGTLLTGNSGREPGYEGPSKKSPGPLGVSPGRTVPHPVPQRSH